MALLSLEALRFLNSDMKNFKESIVKTVIYVIQAILAALFIVFILAAVFKGAEEFVDYFYLPSQYVSILPT